MSAASPVTKERIFKTAERLFGVHGFPSASLRRITEEAGVNLAAVNYHFGSKEDLYKEVLLRRIRPMNSERLTSLTQAEQLAGDQPVPLRAILDTFIRPLVRRAAEPTLGGISFLCLMSRDLTEPAPFMREDLEREFAPLTTRYTHALGQTLPGLPSSELFWRMQFTLGALLYTAAHQHDFDRMSSGAGGANDTDACIQCLVDFCTAGFGAPPSQP